MDGFLIIDKDKNITSQGVCNKIKKKFNTSKVGHNGTLDPNTTGVMLIALGQATKLLRLYNEHDKKYLATITFGYDSDTLDFDTKSDLIESNMDVKMEDIIKGLDYLKGQDNQIPPLTSSVKINGMKLMEYQRRNIDIELKPRAVKLYDYKIKSDLRLYNNHPEIDIELSVSKGYYVRSLARDLGIYLNGSAILHELRRIEAGEFNINQAKKIEDVEEKDIISIFNFFKAPIVKVNDYIARLVKNGVTLDERQTTLKGFFYVQNNCDIIALYEEVSPQNYKPIIIFK